MILTSPIVWVNYNRNKLSWFRCKTQKITIMTITYPGNYSVNVTINGKRKTLRKLFTDDNGNVIACNRSNKSFYVIDTRLCTVSAPMSLREFISGLRND